MRIVEVITPAANRDSLAGIAEHFEVLDFWCGATAEDGRQSYRFLVGDEARQGVVDALQSLIAGSDNSRIIILPVDASLPRPPEEKKDNGKSKSISATREELFSAIEKGARLDSNFVLLTVLSTIVAAIGLAEDNIAVVVGAMVIAPLLGPNIALAFGTSLGDRGLMWRGFKTNLAGLALALLLAVIIGTIWPVDLSSREILARTDVGLDGVALALASGAAAALSLTTGLSSTLVGVMVAVALLPPTATLGMLLGGGQPHLALGAALLLAVNVVCVLLSAMSVFLLKGVRPRTWHERSQARQSVAISVVLWVVLLVVLVGTILLRGNLDV